MSYTLHLERTANGLPITRLVISGKMSEDEANLLMVELSPGGRHAGMPLLVISEDSTEINPGARRIFTSQRTEAKSAVATAVVTRSIVMRVTVNFIGRVNGNPSTKL